MVVYRLTKAKYAKKLSGLGASKSSTHRWNSRGTSMLYTSQSRALAVSEVAAHLTLEELPPEQAMLTIYIPDSVSMQSIMLSSLPLGWDCWPAIAKTKAIGDAFIQENEHCVLKVPSALIGGDFNFLINSLHPQFSEIKIINNTPFVINQRMLKL